MRRLVLASCDMKTRSTLTAVAMLHHKGEPAMSNITIGMDIGDKKHVICVLDKAGHVIENCTIDNNKESLDTFFAKYKGATIAIEASTHSPWISRQLSSMGCKVLVCCTRLTHRGKQAQIDLELLQARDILVKNRANLINHVRGSVKSPAQLLYRELLSPGW